MRDRGIQRLLSEARRQGFTVSQRRSNHYKITSPDGQSVFCPSTPSDHRSLLNARAALRRLGATVS